MTRRQKSDNPRGRLVEELGLIARKNVYGFSLDAVPEVGKSVARLKQDGLAYTHQDVRRAIELGINTIAPDHHLNQIGMWLFGIPAESRRFGLMDRRNAIGQQVGRSASSIRQSIQPTLLTSLTEFLTTAPAGILGPADQMRSAYAIRSEASEGIRVYSLAMSVLLNTANYRKSTTTYTIDLEATRTTDFYHFYIGLPQAGCHHGVTQQVGNGRLVLVRVGHHMRPEEEDVTYKVTPPWRIGERFQVQFRHRFLFSERRQAPQEFTRGIAIRFDTVEWVRLSIWTPNDVRYAPEWRKYDPLERTEVDALLPLIETTERLRHFGITVDSPPVGYLYGLHLDEPAQERG